MLRVPLKKLNRDLKTVTFFLFIILMGLAINTLFILPLIDNAIVTIIYGVIHLGLIINFLTAMILDPGYVKPNEGYQFQELLNKLDPVFLCPDWEVIRTPRSRHCNLWNRWVERYDHHWPYINNWVGYRNHFFFVCFLLFTLTLWIFQITITSIAFTKDANENSWKFIRDYHPKIWFLWTAVFVYIVSGFFTLPVALLLFTHVVNFMTFRTTHERYSSSKNEIDTMASSIKSNTKSSILGSILRSDLLTNDNAELNEITPTLHRLRTNNDSIIEDVNKEGVVDGNYIAEMEYSQPKKAKKRNTWGWRNFWKMIFYKAPSQSHAKRIVERHMKLEKEKKDY